MKRTPLFPLTAAMLFVITVSTGAGVVRQYPEEQGIGFDVGVTVGKLSDMAC